MLIRIGKSLSLPNSYICHENRCPFHFSWFQSVKESNRYATMKTTYMVIILLLVLICLLVKYHKIDSYKRPPIKHMKSISNQFIESQSEHDWIKRMDENYKKINKRIYKVCEKAHSNFTKSKNNSSWGGMKNYGHAYIKNFIIDEDNHLGFCGHPKVASSSTMFFFEKLMPSSVLKKSIMNGERKLTNIHSRIYKEFKLSEDTIYNIGKKNSTTSFMSLLKFYKKQKKILSFTFVRHPYERLVSAFKDKTDGHDPNFKMIQGLNFPEFIKHVLEEYERDKNCTQFVDKVCFGINAHWRPFNSRCLYCNVSYDVIGTDMLSFNDNMRYIILKQKLERIIPVSALQKENPYTKENKGTAGTEQHLRTIETKKYFSQLKNITIRKLYEMYAFDFELFNYDADGYKGSDNTQKE